MWLGLVSPLFYKSHVYFFDSIFNLGEIKNYKHPRAEILRRRWGQGKWKCVTVTCLCPTATDARPSLAAIREEFSTSGREGACDAVAVA